ncbi:transmembrane protein 245 [Coccinella septempunctata]|uniref:transmembrane protein 245 n=1 Tax=Coccinella septempunctata TaxID=41139 RepID=UPI001D073AF2|nr:transmembrane protein 245 [Coccinella septempunctata]
MDTRSPLEGIFNIIGGGLPQGHDKLLKQAVYNAVALLLVSSCCAAGWALFVILEPFTKPLMWAVLVGSVLHPLKRSLRDRFQDWFETLESTNTPVVLGIFLLPMNIVNNISEFIGDTLMRHIKVITSLSCVMVFAPVIYFFTPSLLIRLFWNLLWCLDLLLVCVLNITSFSYDNADKPDVSDLEKDETCHIQYKEEKSDPLTLELFESPSKKHDVLTRTNSEISNKRLESLGQEKHSANFEQPRVDKTRDSKKSSKFHRSSSESYVNPSNRIKTGFLQFGISSCRRKWVKHIEEEKNDSTFYLYTLMWACAAMLFWKNVVLLPLLPLPILLYVVKHIGSYLRIWQCINTNFWLMETAVLLWFRERHDALVPIPIRGLNKIIHKINTSIKNAIRNSIDTVSSCVVILGLIVFLFCASVFIIIQIYAEAIMLVQITSNIINQTVVHNPELRQLLPDTFDETVDSILDNAYLYGREGISKAVRSLMNDVNTSKSEKIEKQILELWDRVYQSWMTSNSPNGPSVTQEAVLSSWEAFVADIKKSPEMFNISGLIEFGKQNIGTLLSLLDSVWSLVKGNFNLVLGSMSAVLSVILGGGTAVMNFILNMIVFLTTLFYLLNSSGVLYKPVEIMTNFSPSGNRLGLALESAINGVFAASFKMAAFYGLWTWFIHNLFGVRIVYIPSAFATILGAVPFLGTYWAGVPAVLDLWLAQERGLAAFIFALFQFLPTSIVDTTIYKEIKGGHPYLTGLAIAGGVFCLGVEGAIIGPILLCGLYVAMDLSTNIFRESPSEETLNVHLSQIRK